MEEAFGQIEDPNQVMLEAINQIKAADRTESSIVTALEVIDRCCDDRDCARNAEKLDGIQPLLDLLGAYKDSIRERTLEILALLTSNNPEIQDVCAKRGGLKILLELVNNASPGSEERQKAFRALVSLIRCNVPLEDEFLGEHNGISVTISCMSSVESAKAQEKALSFTRSLAQTERLKTPQVDQLASATAALLHADLAEANLQYCETLASCADDLAGLASAGAAAELEAAIVARLKSAKVDDEVERPTLEEARKKAKR